MERKVVVLMVVVLVNRIDNKQKKEWFWTWIIENSIENSLMALVLVNR
jgi:hypothetical protein